MLVVLRNDTDNGSPVKTTTVTTRMSFTCLTQPFIRYVDALQRLLNNDQLPLTFVDDGLLVQDLQQCSKVVMLQAKIPSHAFRHFRCRRCPALFALPSAELGKLLTKVLPSGEQHYVSFDFVEGSCVVRVEREGLMLARHRLFLVEYDDPYTVDLDACSRYTHQLAISLRDLCHSLSRLALLHQHLELLLVQHRDSSYVVLRARSDPGCSLDRSHSVLPLSLDKGDLLQFPDDDQDHDKKEEDDDDEDNEDSDHDDDKDKKDRKDKELAELLKDLRCEEDARVFVSSSYNMKFLTPMQQLCPFAERCTLLLAKDFPLQLRLVGDMGSLSYIVAPELDQ